MNRWLIVALVLFCSNQAAAVPPDKVVHLKVGENRFEPGPQGHWLAEPFDPSLLESKAFDTREVFLSGKKQGQTLLLLSNSSIREVLFWKVIVGDHVAIDNQIDTSLLEKNCKCDPDTKPVSCRVLDKKCIQSLKKWIDASNIQSDELHLIYSAQSLQEVLREIDKRLAEGGLKGITLSFAGVNLRIEGVLSDRGQWRKLMKIVYENMVGKLLIEDKTRILETSEGIEPVR